jgi:site-specific DNA-adenine methylase
LKTATLLCGGFAAAIERAGPGDVVYCDPPYAGRPGDWSSFTRTRQQTSDLNGNSTY